MHRWGADDWIDHNGEGGGEEEGGREGGGKGNFVSTRW